MMQSISSIKPWQREYFSTGYKITFLNALQLRMQAGESVGRAMAAVIRGERNPNKLRDMTPALEALDQGEPVVCAMQRLRFFDSTALAILHAGERSGMHEAIASAIAHLSVRHAWFRQHALVIFILANEMLSALASPVVVYREILPWMREHISPPGTPEAMLRYQTDMAMAENLTVSLMLLGLFVLVLVAFNLYRIGRLQAPTRILMFFSDGAMGVGFKLAAAMLHAGVTIEDVARDLAKQAPGWSRRFWAAVDAQLQQASEPALALLQNGLHGEERSLLANHANARQLAATLNVLAGDRESRAKRGRDLILIGGTLLTVAYIFLCLGLALWIYMTYDNTLTAGLEAIGSGF